MPRGRPPLRIGAHGKITRAYLGGGVWMARCRYRDSDGVTRRVERRGPPDEHDQHGKLAEDALIEALVQRRTSEADEISLDTRIVTLVDQHIDRLVEDGRSVRTIDTYRYAAKLLAKIIAGVRVGESTPARIDAAIRSMRRAHGDVMAVQSKTLLKGALHLAVMANVIGSNPVRDVSPLRSKKTGQKGAPALTADELRVLLGALRASGYCQKNDLVDPITVFMATGLRISELLGLRWQDFDEQAATLSVTGKLVRASGQGLVRVDNETKTAAGRRTVPLPKFAIKVLVERRKRPFLGEQTMIFPSMEATWRDPDNFRARWRKVREDLGVPDVTSHSFRKSLATLIDDEGLSARITADHLGHARVSETMDTYMARGRVHTKVADLLDRRINDE
jgi:integrase